VYDKLIERYPLSDKADDARARLKDLGKPIPTPSKESIAENKAEEASRSELGHFHSLMATFHKAPEDIVRASKVGEPTLVDPSPTSAPEIIRAAGSTALGLPTGGNSSVNVEKVTGADATKSEAVPRSDAAPGTAAAPAAEGSAPAESGSAAGSAPAASPPPASAPAASSPATTTPAAPANSDSSIGDLTPNLTPNGTAQPSGGAQPAAANASGPSSDTPPPAPPQVNEIQNGNATDKASAANNSSGSNNDQGSSSSKKKKKKGLKKIF
jgi:hypothetical protein